MQDPTEIPQTDPQPWDRQPEEPRLWYLRFERYRLAGLGRTIEGVYRMEQDEAGKTGKRASRHWYAAAKRWRWVDRAAAWDNAELDRARGAAEERRKTIVTSGFALRHERISALQEVADKLMKDIAQGLTWLDDVKGIGSGNTFERVDLIRFNNQLISELRGVLGDIAAEMGDRSTKIDIPPFKVGLGVEGVTDDDLRKQLDGLGRVALEIAGRAGLGPGSIGSDSEDPETEE